MRFAKIIITLATVFLSPFVMAQGGPPTVEVNVANVPEVIIANQTPVPVTGSIVVSGGTTVSGTVNSAQSGPWTVSLDEGEAFFYDSGFSAVFTSELIGPFDLSEISKLRIMARAVNGRVTFELLANLPDSGTGSTLQLDAFEVGTESDNEFETRVYDIPPPTFSIRLTEGEGSANYHFVLIGR